jgi:predicted DNA-binding protein with PD1-like motif
MNYKQIGNDYILRIDKGEEIIETIKSLCTKENITLGTIHGIGALESAEVGLYKVDEQKYYSKIYQGAFEMTSLEGNITTMNNEIYLHLHVNFADICYNTYGGHLTKGIIGATGEIFIHKIEGSIERKKDGVIGLNVFDI